MKQIPALTCCRALFAGWVFAYHVDLQSQYAAWLGGAGALVHAGALGVDGFFLLSGLVLAYAHPALSATLGETRAFLVRRLLRIYPVHLATIAIFAVLIGGALLLGHRPREPARFGLDELWRHLLLVQAWGVSDRWAWNYPSWSISAEWAGYLMFPALWPALRRRGVAVQAGVLVLAAAGVMMAQAMRVRFGLSLTYDGGLLRFLPEFVAGMATVALLRDRQIGLPAPIVAWAGAVLALGGAMAGWDAVAICGLWLGLSGLLLGARQGRRSLLAAVPGLHRLGEISYSFYMSFALVETVQSSAWRAAATLPAAHPWAYGVSTAALTLALGTLLWACVERPAMRLARWRRPATGMLAPGATS